ncbi:proline-rich transmembrane protein 1-like [Mugil cephalus]|uniref:proline-rich transmembrane protein 1-like n=1 Tax=Mugil cephalus TaxID=48193 RepID=UPI001FB62AC3|nr:proline-rich transmembrane protein 1-like [Mugil cephalus]XP_047454745.1 proline-rich transmembrane protein 1-like [Mugil cephalus]
MDPKQQASAPPMGWSDEKSSVAPPPPYQDNPGYGEPGPGYPPQPQGYGYQPQYGGQYGQQPYVAGQQYPAQPVTVAVQPTMYVTQAPLVNPVNDYLCYSIFTMICCCMPLGIAALIYSVSAREANLMGNRAVAERSSRTARTLNHVALGIGIGTFILFIVYAVVMTSVLSH